MLRSLTIRNFAVIEEVRLEPAKGLVALTGETGAGKSILAEALGFLLGARGSADWIRAGAERLEVEGVFEAAVEPPEGLPPGPWVLRRELDRSGRGRARLGGKPITLAQLAALGERLADFHGQHEHQTLLRPSEQLELLDRHARLEGLRGKVEAAWREHELLRRRRDSLSLSEDERLRRLDMCRFQLGEIDAVKPKLGEEAELEALVPRLRNAEKLLHAAGELRAALYEEEGSAVELLGRADRAAEELCRLDPEAEEARRLVLEARTAVEEAASFVGAYRDGIELDPDRLEEALGRQDKLAKLRRKYGPELADVLRRRGDLAAEAEALENHDLEAGTAGKALDAARARLETLCGELHDERHAAAKELSAAVVRELKELGMPGARFEVGVELEEGALGPAGADRVEFVIAANPGEGLKPLRSVASGGEMSRAMLALKTVLSGADRVPVLVFDEVDAGVGGAVARAVGRRLAGLARARQVLVVTHLAQVASFADDHLTVAKSVAAGRTRTAVRRLEGPERLEEMARLLGGREGTEASRRHAEELIAEALRERGGPEAAAPKKPRARAGAK